MKKILKFILIVLLCFFVIILCYGAYVLIDYHRIKDNQVLDIDNKNDEKLQAEVEYSLVSFNIGFGAYEPDYGFFMDGGTESRAWNRKRLDNNLKKIASFLNEQNADFYLIQEVDTNSTRSYHFDERIFLKEDLSMFDSVFALNYDSSYLFYPFKRPIGKSQSGIMTFSKFRIDSGVRRSLPVETTLMKLLDLDRCYTKVRLQTENGETLVLYNFHFSAYTSDGEITVRQMEMMIRDMQYEYNKGSWCIAGGDFNKDIEGTGSMPFSGIDRVYTWSQNVSDSVFEDTDIVKVTCYDKENPVPSCRNADGPYTKSQYQIIIDGFLVSPNVEVKQAMVIDTGFEYSDHNPVKMTFVLKK